MDEDKITPEEINSELTGFNKGEKENKKKNIIIGASVAAVLVIIAIIIIIVLVTKSDDNKGDNQGGGEDGGEEDKIDEVYGEINCIYDIQTIMSDTMIISEEFTKNNDFELYIDGKLKKYTKALNFNSIGLHKVQIRLSKEINMDNMFKGVSDLYSVQMESTKNFEIRKF